MDFGKAFKQRFTKPFDGIIETVMASGPIAKRNRKFGRKMSRVITKALADGEIDEEERRHIERIARKQRKDNRRNAVMRSDQALPSRKRSASS